MEALALVDEWPVPHVAAAVRHSDGTVVATGDTSASFRIASLAKTMVGYTAMVAVEEGIVALDTPVGQPGCTLRHLLAHAGGYAFDGAEPIARPGTRRIYSNTGIELAAHCIEQAAGMPYEQYQREALFEPLGMTSTTLRGTPAHKVVSTVDDLVGLLGEWNSPRLVSEGSRDAFRSPQFPTLAGVVPGVGRFDPCPWGLGCEIKGLKRPHWMGNTASPGTYGHFGGAGTFLMMEPTTGIGIVALTDRPFDEWSADALRMWPAFIDAVLGEVGAR